MLIAFFAVENQTRLLNFMPVLKLALFKKSTSPSSVICHLFGRFVC